MMQGHNKQKQPDAPEPLAEDSSKNGGGCVSTSTSIPPLTNPAESSMDMDYDLDWSSNSAALEDELDFDQSAMLGVALVRAVLVWLDGG
jgi:hypothetical protein